MTRETACERSIGCIVCLILHAVRCKHQLFQPRIVQRSRETQNRSHMHNIDIHWLSSIAVVGSQRARLLETKLHTNVHREYIESIERNSRLDRDCSPFTHKTQRTPPLHRRVPPTAPPTTPATPRTSIKISVPLHFLHFILRSSSSTDLGRAGSEVVSKNRKARSAKGRTGGYRNDMSGSNINGTCSVAAMSSEQL